MLMQFQSSDGTRGLGVLATHMGKCSALFNLKDLKATRKRRSCHKIVIGNWKIASF